LDTKLCCLRNSRQELQKLLNPAQNFAIQNHFEFNKKKCICMVPCEREKLFINKEEFSFVKSFVYFGITFFIEGRDLKSQLEIAERKCSAAISLMGIIGANSSGFVFRLSSQFTTVLFVLERNMVLQ
jgi:hypothetical protein